MEGSIELLKKQKPKHGTQGHFRGKTLQAQYRQDES